MVCLVTVPTITLPDTVKTLVLDVPTMWGSCPMGPANLAKSSDGLPPSTLVNSFIE